jgi:LuxR family maltose regulon positive regulatory protein
MFYWLETPRITQCRVLIAQGTETGLQQAVELLQEYRQQSETQHNTRQLIDILHLQSLAYHKQGRSNEATTVLERAVTLGQSGGFIRPFVEAGLELSDYLEKLRNKGVAPDYIAQILNACENDEQKRLNDDPSQERSHPSPLTSRGFGFQPLVDPLSDREFEVLKLLAQRLSNKEIATELVISPLTVKTHTINIYQKLGVKNRRQAVSKAVALKLIADR